MCAQGFSGNKIFINVFLNPYKERSGSMRSLQPYRELLKQEIFFLFWNSFPLSGFGSGFIIPDHPLISNID
jgi:hypothetical protein